MKGSQGNTARQVEYRPVIYFVWRIQYRRVRPIGRVRPDGIWHDRAKDYKEESQAILAKELAQRMAGAHLFEYRINKQERTYFVRVG